MAPVTVTLRDVARLAGVSRATAARALNGYGAVSEDTLAKVSSAAETLDYRINRVAQALRRGQSNYIGFVPGRLGDPFFATVTEHLGDVLESAGYLLVTAGTSESADRERRILQTLQTHQVSGLVIAPTFAEDSGHIREFQRSGVPLVVIDRAVPDLDVDTVTVDNVGGVRSGLEHLVRLGHRRIGYLTNNPEVASAHARLEAYRSGLADHGIPYDPGFEGTAVPSREGIHQAARELLLRPDRPTAILTGDNRMTVALLRTCEDIGLRVGEDLALVSFDDFDLADLVKPGITAIAQPVARIGSEAGRLILERLAGRTEPAEHVLLPTQLIVRGSSVPPAH